MAKPSPVKFVRKRRRLDPGQGEPAENIPLYQISEIVTLYQHPSKFNSQIVMADMKHF